MGEAGRTVIPIDELIRDFTTYLDGAWGIVQRFSHRRGTDSFVGDWLQASWESLVEASLAEGVLDIYGGGADLYPDSSRVYRPSANPLPTHIVAFLPRDGTSSLMDELTGQSVSFPAHGRSLDRFVSSSPPFFQEAPPFDHALTESDDGRFLFPNAALTFFVRPILEEEI